MCRQCEIFTCCNAATQDITFSKEKSIQISDKTRLFTEPPAQPSSSQSPVHPPSQRRGAQK